MNTPPSKVPLTGLIMPWVVLAACLFFTWYGWHLVNVNSHTEVMHHFKVEVDRHKAAIVARMINYKNSLRSGVALMDAAAPVSRRQWQAFVENLKVTSFFPGIQGMGWSIFVKPADLASHTKAVRAEGFPAYEVRPVGARDLYSAILYLEPFDKRNQRAIGFDMFSEPTRRAAMELARDSGLATLSGKVTLVQEGEGEIQAGCLVYLPVYQHAMPMESVEERRRAIVGFVYAPFRMNDLMDGILGDKFPLIALQIFDGTGATPAGLMYDSHRHEPARTLGEEYHHVETVVIAQRPWTLEFFGTQAFAASADDEKAWFVLIGGLVTSLLLFGFAVSLTRSSNRAIGLAHKMTVHLRDSEERSRALFNVAVTGMVVIDHHGLIQSFNPAAEKIFGYAAEEVMGHNVKCLMPDPYHSAHDGYLNAFQETGVRKIIGIGREVVGQRKNGDTFPMWLSVGFANLEGQMLFVGSIVDIAHRVQAEEEIKEHLHLVRLRAAIGATLILDNPLEEMLQTCATIMVEKLEVAFVRVWLYNHAEKMLILHASAGLYTHLDGAHGRIPLGAFKIGQIAATLTPHFTNQVIGDPRVHDQAWAKEQGMAAFAGYPLVVDDHLVGVLGIFSRHTFSETLSDVLVSIANELSLGIQHKQAEAALVAAKEAAEAANHAKSEFLNMMSHELRTPLTVILGYIPLLVDPARLPMAKKARALLAEQEDVRGLLDKLYGKIGDMAEEIRRNGEHLLTLINDLLDISKIEAGKLELNIKPLSSATVAQGVVNALRGKAQEKGLLLVSLCDDTPVVADEVRLKQILLNLVGNAVKFTDTGEIRITSQLEGPMMVFSVADTGVGIPASDIEMVFERFHQVDSSSTRKAGGTGLGLTITKRLVELHGGTIHVTSTLGQGSVFRFTIPRQEV